MAFDSIMVFEDRFKDHILADQIHVLSVSFLVPQLRRQFGGCAGNIVYGLNLLGCEAHVLATVGKDFGSYAEWLDQNGISGKYLRILEDEYTAQAFVITDVDDNQITAFHPGAMEQCHLARVPADAGIKLGLIAPEGRRGMMEHATQFHEMGVPFIFDPGQGISMFSGEELDWFIDRADWIACNDYEAKILCRRTGLEPDQLARRVRALIITLGAKGSVIRHDSKVTEIAAAQPDAVRDPTGCGDAYRAGLIYGLVNELDWETTGRIASLMGAIKIGSAGGQGHRFDTAEFARRFEENFGCALDMG